VAGVRWLRVSRVDPLVVRDAAEARRAAQPGSDVGAWTDAESRTSLTLPQSEAPKVKVRSAAKADNDLLVRRPAVSQGSRAMQLPAVRLLAKATKKARTFETQKVVRKLKKLQCVANV